MEAWMDFWPIIAIAATLLCYTLVRALLDRDWGPAIVLSVVGVVVILLTVPNYLRFKKKEPCALPHKQQFLLMMNTPARANDFYKKHKRLPEDMDELLGKNRVQSSYKHEFLLEGGSVVIKSTANLDGDDTLDVWMNDRIVSDDCGD